MASFIADKIVMDGLTFDDVLLIPAYSEVLPKTVELQLLLLVREVLASSTRTCRLRNRRARWLSSSALRTV